MSYYGENFVVRFYTDGSGYYVWKILTKSVNGIATPMDITVGTPEEEMIHVYGEPDKAFRAGRVVSHAKCSYFGSELDGKQMLFELKNGIITSIKCFIAKQ